MGFCKRRYFFLSLCFLQWVSVVQRQVFDFLGYLWIPILVNFFELIFIIFGFFGAYQYRPNYVIAYLLWHLVYLGWNIFIICLYLDVAGLNHETNIVLKLDAGSGSWWKGGPGCDAHRQNCLFDYIYVEIFQAVCQCLLAFCNIITGICLSRMFLEEDDSSSHKRKNPKRVSLYSIEFSSQLENRHGDSDNDFDNLPSRISPKPMTPRRVKRRSVMTRGTTSRVNTHSNSRQTHPRSSIRNSRRVTQNPVTRLLEQQQKNQLHYENTTVGPPLTDCFPNYYSQNSNVNSNKNIGHANPSYQQSSTQSLNEPEDFDDIYNNRPASVRSGYSNFHGSRVISYSPQKHFHSHATPQVPLKRNVLVNKNSTRSIAFLNSGPPAYTTQSPYLDSETTI